MYETSLLVFTKAKDVIEIIHEYVARSLVFMTAQGIKDAYLGHAYYIIILKFGRVNINLRSRLGANEDANTPQEIVHI